MEAVGLLGLDLIPALLLVVKAFGHVILSEFRLVGDLFLDLRPWPVLVRVQAYCSSFSRTGPSVLGR